LGSLKGAVQALEELGLPAGSWHELPTWRQVADEHYSEVEV
jgi:hypothetical protein